MTRKSAESTAAAWLGKRDRGFTSQEKADFDAWLESDSRHWAAVRQVERTWIALDRLRALAPAGLGPSMTQVFAPRPRRLPWIIPIGLAASLGALAFGLWSHRAGLFPAERPYSTVRGGFDRVTLDDGSQVELNEATALEVKFTPTERRIRLLRGEAHFHVTKNPARPFIVAADSVEVRAVGTAFDVNMAQAGVAVLVTEGKVRASAQDQTVFVAAGEQITLSASKKDAPRAPAQMSPAQIDRALAWELQTLDLEETPLSDLVVEFNRHNASKIILADPQLGAMRMSGRFRLDNEKAFVRLLDSTYGIASEPGESGETVLRKSR